MLSFTLALRVLRSLLALDPKARPEALDLLSSGWLRSVEPESQIFFD